MRGDCCRDHRLESPSAGAAAAARAGRLPYRLDYTARQGWHGRRTGWTEVSSLRHLERRRMRVDGVERAGLIGDYGRWRRLIFHTPANMSFQRMDDSFQGYAAAVDMTAKTVTDVR